MAFSNIFPSFSFSLHSFFPPLPPSLSPSLPSSLPHSLLSFFPIQACSSHFLPSNTFLPECFYELRIHWGRRGEGGREGLRYEKYTWEWFASNQQVTNHNFISTLDCQHVFIVLFLTDGGIWASRHLWEKKNIRKKWHVGKHAIRHSYQVWLIYDFYVASDPSLMWRFHILHAGFDSSIQLMWRGRRYFMSRKPDVFACVLRISNII